MTLMKKRIIFYLPLIFVFCLLVCMHMSACIVLQHQTWFIFWKLYILKKGKIGLWLFNNKKCLNAAMQQSKVSGSQRVWFWLLTVYIPTPSWTSISRDRWSGTWWTSPASGSRTRRTSSTATLSLPAPPSSGQSQQRNS